MTPARIGDRGTYLLDHCGQPMVCKQTSTTWTGKPGRGAQHDRRALECLVCGAEATILQREPDREVMAPDP